LSGWKGSTIWGEREKEKQDVISIEGSIQLRRRNSLNCDADPRSLKNIPHDYPFARNLHPKSFWPTQVGRLARKAEGNKREARERF
jgi:hypothetical protein